MIAYPRTALADELVHQLQGKTAFGDAQNGLFLAAPRRTGKTTFLRGDLCPALEKAGVVVVYVDLWADATRDPGVLIADAIGRALQPHLGVIARAAKKTGLNKVSLAGWLDVDTSRIGKLDGLTLVDALRALHETAGKPVALVIDEAQHALTSEAGEAAMTALKSARDQLNRPGVVNLMLVMSGSDRDKLLRLVNTNGSPFYGSQIKTMPALGQDFIAHIVQLIEAQRPELAPVDQATLQAAFEGFGSRPQFFMEALRFYREKTGRDKAVTPQQAQNALESLRQRMPALVWKSARGEYAVEDAAMHRWYETRTAAGTWPPLSRQGNLLPDTE